MNLKIQIVNKQRQFQHPKDQSPKIVKKEKISPIKIKTENQTESPIMNIDYQQYIITGTEIQNP